MESDVPFEKSVVGVSLVLPVTKSPVGGVPGGEWDRTGRGRVRSVISGSGVREDPESLCLWETGKVSILFPPGPRVKSQGQRVPEKGRSNVDGDDILESGTVPLSTPGPAEE